VVVTGNVLKVVHRVCSSGGKRLPLGRGPLVVDRQRVVVGRGGGLRVHLGHLVAVHDGRHRHQHVGVRHGPHHRLLPELVAPHRRRQQRILGAEAVRRQQLLLREVAAAAVRGGRHDAVRGQAVVSAPRRPGRGQDVVLGHGPLDPAGPLPLLVVLVLLLVLLRGIHVQLHHVGRTAAAKLRMVMLPGVVLVYVLIT